jgi:predicted CoA-binding protein
MSAPSHADGSPDVRSSIQRFFGSNGFAVAGASNDPRKYGHRVFAALLGAGFRPIPVNPGASAILGIPSFERLTALPWHVEAVSIVTPPTITERIVEEAIAAGALRLWIQPGAESAKAIDRALAAGLDVIAGGPCLLVEIASVEGPRDQTRPPEP